VVRDVLWQEALEDEASVYSDDETELESFTTVLEGADDETEEFTIFKKTMAGKLRWAERVVIIDEADSLASYFTAARQWCTDHH